MKYLPGIVFACLSAVVVAACTGSERGSIGADCETGFCDGDGGGPTFTDPTSKDASLGDDADGRLQCIGTECPAPWATCISEGNPTYKCGTDLLRDSDNCGACGNECGDYKPVHMISRCFDGACELSCYNKPEDLGSEDRRNCNGLVDDGCEVDVLQDANNCGACGNACGDGVTCIEGRCGCPPGLTECYGECIDATSDDNNCGACGNLCKDPDDACSPLQPNTKYGCADSKCGNKMCAPGYADCNGDVGQSACGGDGCEVEIDTKDNCGGCGIACTKPHQECVNEGNGLECAVPCERFGRVLCGKECTDLLTNVFNCGACDAGCRKAGANEVASCSKGVCHYECNPGFGDCNGDPTDGCETNLSTHPGNCGACGNVCNLAAGQPCIEGKCLMKECDQGATN